MFTSGKAEFKYTKDGAKVTKARAWGNGSKMWWGGGGRNLEAFTEQSETFMFINATDWQLPLIMNMANRYYKSDKR